VASWASCRQVRGLVCAGHHKPHGGLLRLAAASPAAGCSDSEPAAPSKTNQIDTEIQKSEMSSSIPAVPSKINQIDREIQKSEMNSLPECRRLPESPWTVAHRSPCERQLARVRASRRPPAEGSLSGEHTSMPPPLADGSQSSSPSSLGHRPFASSVLPQCRWLTDGEESKNQEWS
jgi:hypothetical protein